MINIILGPVIYYIISTVYIILGSFILPTEQQHSPRIAWIHSTCETNNISVTEDASSAINHLSTPLCLLTIILPLKLKRIQPKRF